MPNKFRRKKSLRFIFGHLQLLNCFLVVIKTSTWGALFIRAISLSDLIKPFAKL
jgi:hypothetical protein